MVLADFSADFLPKINLVFPPKIDPQKARARPASSAFRAIWAPKNTIGGHPHLDHDAAIVSGRQYSGRTSTATGDTDRDVSRSNDSCHYFSRCRW